VKEVRVGGIYLYIYLEKEWDNGFRGLIFFLV